MLLKTTIAFILLFYVSLLSSEEYDTTFLASHTIESKVLDDERTIQVHLPQTYYKSEKKYPVLYILDGQRLFFLGASIQQTMSAPFNVIPELIVVGINNRYPDRFSHFSGTDFMDFIDQEVFTLIDNNYRTSDERLIFGWEYAGSFAFQSLIDKPERFDGHIIASPYPIHEQRGDKPSKNEQLENKLNARYKSTLYFSVSANEGMVSDGTEELATMLSKKAPPSFRWASRVIDGESHDSTPYATLYHGLKHYYTHYEILSFTTLEHFREFGGIEAVKAYYEDRAERYGFDSRIDNWTRFSLISRAQIANDFEAFDGFVTELADQSFYENIAIRRLLSIAATYKDNSQFEQAERLLNKFKMIHPTSERLHKAILDLQKEKVQ